MSMKRTLLIFYVLSIGIITYGQKIVSTDVYKYPFQQDDAKWKSYKSARDRIEALQIPSVIVDSIETSKLLDICLEYPYLTDIFAFDDIIIGFEKMAAQFNGFYYLRSRFDLKNALLAKCIKTPDVFSEIKKNTLNENGKFSFQCCIIPLILTQWDVLSIIEDTEMEKLKESVSRNLTLFKDNPKIFGFPTIFLWNQLSTILSQESSAVKEGILLRSYASYIPSTRTTPFGSVVNVLEFNGEDFSTAEKLNLRNTVTSNYGVEVLGDATLAYNCHAYAWHVSEGGDSVWINDQNQHVYWQDGSYIEVPESLATKVSYSGDHSAVRVNNTEYISKWGAWPLVKHSPTNTPIEYGQYIYGIPDKFYKKNVLSISGSSVVCGFQDYYVSNLPTNAIVSWNLSVNGSNPVATLTSDTPAVNQCRITRNETSYSGFSSVLTATVTYQGDTITVLSKNLYGHLLPQMGIVTITNTENGRYKAYQLTSFNGADLQPNVRYEIMCTHFPGMTLTPTAPASVLQGLTFRPIDENTYEVIMPQGGFIEVDAEGGGCYEFSFTLGTSSSGGYLLNLNNWDGRMFVYLQTDENKEKAANESKQVKEKDNNVDLEWTLEVYNSSNNKRMVSKKVTSNDCTLNTSSWEKGIYIVRAIIGKEILSEKINIQ